jgi:hypothetical protein
VNNIEFEEEMVVGWKKKSQTMIRAGTRRGCDALL